MVLYWLVGKYNICSLMFFFGFVFVFEIPFCLQSVLVHSANSVKDVCIQWHIEYRISILKHTSVPGQPALLCPQLPEICLA
jgi:hypothetical protein